MGYVKQVGYGGIVIWILFSAFIVWVNVVLFMREPEEKKNFYKTSKLVGRVEELNFR